MRVSPVGFRLGIFATGTALALAACDPAGQSGERSPGHASGLRAEPAPASAENAAGSAVGNVAADTAAGEVPAEVVEAARAGLPEWLDRIPQGHEAGYGFATRAAMARATLGDPWHVWTVPGDVLAGAAPRGPPVVPTDEWRFPIVLDGAARALLTVGRLEGRWAAVEIGGAELAVELDRFASARGRTGDPGLRRVLLRLHAAHLDFLAIPDRSVATERITWRPTRWVAGVVAASAPGLAAGAGLTADEVVAIGRRLRTGD